MTMYMCNFSQRWHLLQAFSMEGSIHLEIIKDVHANPIVEAPPSTAKDASVAKHQLVCCGQDAGKSVALLSFQVYG